MCMSLDTNKKAGIFERYPGFHKNPDNRSIKAMFESTLPKNRKPVQQTFFTPAGNIKKPAKKLSKYLKNGKLRKKPKKAKRSWEKLTIEQKNEIIRLNKKLTPSNIISRRKKPSSIRESFWSIPYPIPMPCAQSWGRTRMSSSSERWGTWRRSKPHSVWRKQAIWLFRLSTRTPRPKLSRELSIFFLPSTKHRWESCSRWAWRPS